MLCQSRLRAQNAQNGDLRCTGVEASRGEFGEWGQRQVEKIRRCTRGKMDPTFLNVSGKKRSLCASAHSHTRALLETTVVVAAAALTLKNCAKKACQEPCGTCGQREGAGGAIGSI